MLSHLTHLKQSRTGRFSSWDQTGRNADAWQIQPGETRVLADIRGPGCIMHIWMTQQKHYRECLLKITWDHAEKPSVLVPLGDFFCLGHGLVNSFQSFLFSASTPWNNQFNQGCALNCYAQMPFRERALVELVNESSEVHGQYFYIDYETYDQPLPADSAYFHAEFHRENPFGGWGHEILVNTPEADIVNKERLAWENNYIILQASGRGHYIGCNISVTNFRVNGNWRGRGHIRGVERAVQSEKSGDRKSQLGDGKSPNHTTLGNPGCAGTENGNQPRRRSHYHGGEYQERNPLSEVRANNHEVSWL